MLDFFGNKIEEDALKIECSGYEVNMMFLDFVRMLSSTRHLAMCVFVNGNADVDTFKRLERFSSWSKCFKVVRDMNKDVSWQQSAKQYKDMYVELTPKY